MLIRTSSHRARLLRPVPAHAKRAARASEERLREIVEAVSIPRSYRREHAANRRIAGWIADELSALGLLTSFEGRFDNVVALTPAALQRPSILIGAHYDSVPGCPGADDNASAVAALLHGAELLVAGDPELPLCFVAFNREEDRLAGSAEFVAAYLPSNRLELRLAHVLEMVGYRDERPGSQSKPPGLPIRVPRTGDFLALLANRGSRREATRVLRLARSYFPDFPVLSLKVYFQLQRFFPVLLRSDHASFWRRGIPSLLWTDTSEYRNPNYHLRSDRPATLDYAFLRRVTQLLVVTASSAAERT